MFSIEIAGLVVRINNRYDHVHMLCRDYIVSEDRPVDFSVSVNDEERAREVSRAPHLFFGDGYAESVILYEKISNCLPAFDAFIMHSSVVAVDGKAYCFAAESGTGKSTHTRYWREVLGDRLTVINGDKPVYRFVNGELFAFGTPWNGKENWGERTSAPLKALCLLERGEENAIFPIDPFSALNELLHHFHLADSSQVNMPKLIDLMDAMLQTVPVYRLRCRNDVSAAELAINTLIGDAAK